MGVGARQPIRDACERCRPRQKPAGQARISRGAERLARGLLALSSLPERATRLQGCAGLRPRRLSQAVQCGCARFLSVTPHAGTVTVTPGCASADRHIAQHLPERRVMPGFQVLEVPADADGPTLDGAMWYPCSEPPAEIDLGEITAKFGRRPPSPRTAPRVYQRRNRREDRLHARLCRRNLLSVGTRRGTAPDRHRTRAHAGEYRD